MGTDLVSACIFCAGWLLGMDLAPRDGLSGQMGFSYATMARRYDVTPERVDSSDVTPKFVLVGLGNAWPAPDGLGAGTPASEWQARVAFGTSHDQQERRRSPEEDLDRILDSGTGRYENFALLGRIRLGDRDSIEVALNRRAESATDLVDIGPRNGVVSESRSCPPRAPTTRSAGGTAGPDSRPRSAFTVRSPTATTRPSARFRPRPDTSGEAKPRAGGRAAAGPCSSTARACGATSTSRGKAQPDFTQRKSSEAVGVRSDPAGRRLLVAEDADSSSRRPTSGRSSRSSRSRCWGPRRSCSTRATTRTRSTTRSTSTSRSGTRSRPPSARASTSGSPGAPRR